MQIHTIRYATKTHAGDDRPSKVRVIREREREKHEDTPLLSTTIFLKKLRVNRDHGQLTREHYLKDKDQDIEKSRLKKSSI